MVRKVDTVANIMLLDMTDFDTILGMAWLASCHATLNCHNKSIKFTIPGEPSFVFQVEQSEVFKNLITLMNAQHLLWKGCQGFLVFINDIEKEEPKIGDVPVV